MIIKKEIRKALSAFHEEKEKIKNWVLSNINPDLLNVAIIWDFESQEVICYALGDTEGLYPRDSFLQLFYVPRDTYRDAQELFDEIEEDEEAQKVPPHLRYTFEEVFDDLLEEIFEEGLLQLESLLEKSEGELQRDFERGWI